MDYLMDRYPIVLKFLKTKVFGNENINSWLH